MRSAVFILAVLFIAIAACTDSNSGGLPCCTITVSGMTNCICTDTKNSNCTIKNASATACILACKGQPDLQGTPRMTCGDAGM